MDQLILLLAGLAILIGGLVVRNQKMKAIMNEPDEPVRRVAVPGAEPLFDALNLMRLEVENAKGTAAATSVGVHGGSGSVGVQVRTGHSSLDPQVQEELKTRMREVMESWYRIGPEVQDQLNARGVAGQFLATFHELPVPQTREDRQAMLRGIEETLQRFTVI